MRRRDSAAACFRDVGHCRVGPVGSSVWTLLVGVVGAVRGSREGLVAQGGKLPAVS